MNATEKLAVIGATLAVSLKVTTAAQTVLDDHPYPNGPAPAALREALAELDRLIDATMP